MSRLTLLLLVDAFRPDYLRDAPYLRRLAAEAALGRLREPFGFLPRAAYFGGLSPEQLGYSHMFRQADGDSPFTASCGLPAGLTNAVRPPIAARAFLDERGRANLPPYAHYVSSLRVPHAILPHIAPVEIHAPWDTDVGYRSLFHELDAAGMPWFAAAWPGTTTLEDPSDAGILAELLAKIEPSHRFAFVHFQELDAAGHWHGPEAAALRAHVARTDALVESLMRELSGRFAALDLIAFGDHGMVTVTGHVDVRPALAATGLVPGVDYLYFLDSTMVRLWFLTSRAEPALRQALADVRGLSLLDPAARRRHRIEGCDARNAHAIYLADPGLVVWPDFFATGGAPPKGMHGYDPDCADNQGIFLQWTSDGRRLPQDAGIVDATGLYGRLREVLGLAPRRAEIGTPRSPFRFTHCQDPRAEARIDRDMRCLVAALRSLAPAAEAIVVTGSFGRGEGGVVPCDGGWAPLNDYDLLVIGGPDVSGALQRATEDLRRGFGLDFLDLAWVDAALEDRPHTMANHDLRYGSRVLWGDTSVLERMPKYAASELPLYEALGLLLNRTGGILSALDQPCEDSDAWTPVRCRYLSTQIHKALVAVGDAYLVEWGAYDSSYAVRAERFASLARGAGVPDVTIAAARRGYAYKLRPYEAVPDDSPREVLAGAVPHVLNAVVRLSRLALQVPAPSISEAAAAVAGTTGGWVAEDNRRLLERPALRTLLGHADGSGVSLRQTIYAVLTLLLADACPQAHGHREHSFAAAASALLARAGKRPFAEPERWEGLRGPAVAAWLEMIH